MTWLTKSLVGFTIVSTLMVYVAFVRDQADSGRWGCEMSWMLPSYIPIAWPDNPSKKYSLYLYREQEWDTISEVSPSGNNFAYLRQPSGHPIIFVPGNAGAFQQVRSIAASAARQFHDPAERGRAAGASWVPLDFYSSTFTAISPAVLNTQLTSTRTSPPYTPALWLTSPTSSFTASTRSLHSTVTVRKCCDLRESRYLLTPWVASPHGTLKLSAVEA